MASAQPLAQRLPAQCLFPQMSPENPHPLRRAARKARPAAVVAHRRSPNRRTTPPVRPPHRTTRTARAQCSRRFPGRRRVASVRTDSVRPSARPQGMSQLSAPATSVSSHDRDSKRALGSRTVTTDRPASPSRRRDHSVRTSGNRRSPSPNPDCASPSEWVALWHPRKSVGTCCQTERDQTHAWPHGRPRRDRPAR